MSDELSTIRQVIEEHQGMKEHIELVTGQLNDQEAIIALEKAHSEWIPGRTEALEENREKLIQTMSLIDEGLKSHYMFEEKILVPLMGELLAEAFINEHGELLKEIARVNGMVANTNFKGLSRDEILSTQAAIQEAISSLHQHKEEHMAAEEAILYMIQRSLEKRRKIGVGK